MTDLEKQVDALVGQETENQRNVYLKMIALGRSLEREAMTNDGTKMYSQAEQDEAVKTAVDAEHALGKSVHYASVTDLLSELDTILATAGTRAAAVEKEDEDDAFAELEKQSSEGPIKAEMILKFKAILDTVDKKHGAIFHERNEALKALRAKYLPEA